MTLEEFLNKIQKLNDLLIEKYPNKFKKSNDNIIMDIINNLTVPNYFKISKEKSQQLFGYLEECLAIKREQLRGNGWMFGMDVDDFQERILTSLDSLEKKCPIYSNYLEKFNVKEN